MEKLKAISPITGEELGVYSIPSTQEIKESVEKSRTAYKNWKNFTIQQRIKYISKMKDLLIQELDEVVDLICKDNGKAKLEALSSDILMCIDSICYYQKYARKILAREKRRKHIFSFPSKFYIEHMPLGVVAIFSPWNFPLQLALLPTISALIAGNTVILKPSEFTPTIGAYIESLATRVNLPKDVLQVLQGAKRVGQDLIENKPDKIFFTGSVATGKKIMEAASKNLIPLELELGGKDPMIVFSDANFERAVNGAVYGAFCNTGQVCVSVERLYVEKSIYDRFVEAVVERVKKIQVGEGHVDIGAMTSPLQIKIVEEQIDDALEKGAKLLTERKQEENFLHPVVLKDVDHSMKIMQEETFGPVLPIMPFSEEAEVIALANGTDFGLNASIWTKDLKKAKRIAQELITGSCAVNDVIKNMANPDMPFGGEKHSGFGRYHGPEGLYSFSRKKSIMINSGKLLKKEINWFPYTKNMYNVVKNMIHGMYGKGIAKRIKKMISAGIGLLRS